MTTSRENEPSPPKPKLDLQFYACGCSFGHYPWDDWEQFALWRGLDARTANIGAAVIREAYNHRWEAELQALCGWGDDGQALLALALREPEQARWCFSRLLDTDGLHGDVHPGTGQWTWGYLGPDSRRVLSVLHNAAT